MALKRNQTHQHYRNPPRVDPPRSPCRKFSKQFSRCTSTSRVDKHFDVCLEPNPLQSQGRNILFFPSSYSCRAVASGQNCIFQTVTNIQQRVFRPTQWRIRVPAGNWGCLDIKHIIWSDRWGTKLCLLPSLPSTLRQVWPVWQSNNIM